VHYLLMENTFCWQR